ncbi:MAG: hypothetical protein Q4E70_00545 [Candidatus Saccharibacteria bacterium]|nr:hypothetical protein [Candidatus Saccharibacteria bacterium]
MKKFFQGIGEIFKVIGNWCKNHKTLVALIATALFVLSQIPLLVNHEIWSDEAIPWEISKQITPENIYELNDAEPHPLLWELILAPFSKNNFPVITLNIISLVIVSLALFLFLRFAPINPFLKLLFIFSNAFFYYNPIIARDYCLVPLSLALIGMTYKNRHEKPLRYALSLVFLSQTHFLMYGLLAILALGFIIEEIKSEHKLGKTATNLLKIMLPVGLSILTVLPMVFGSFENHALITGKIFENSPYKIDLFPVFEITILGMDNIVLNIALLVVVGLFLISLLAENAKIAFYFVASVGFWLFVMLMVYQGYYLLEQKCSLLTMIVLVSLWLLILEPKPKKENLFSKLLNFSEIVKFARVHVKNPISILAFVLVFATIPTTLANATWDLSGSFSHSKENSDYVNSLEKNSAIIEVDNFAYEQFDVATRVLINSDVTIYNLPDDSYTNIGYGLKYNSEYVEKNRERVVVDPAEVEAKIAEFSKNYEHVYVMVNSGRVYCNHYERSIPDWLKQYEITTELDINEYRVPSQVPTLVFKAK